MNHFYQLNLAAPLQARVNRWKTGSYAAIGFVIGILLFWSIWLYGEYKRETAGERLSKMSLYALRVCEVHDKWSGAVNAYKVIHTLVERQDQRSAAEFLPVAKAIRLPRRSGDGPSLQPPLLGYSPQKLVVERDKGLTLDFWLPFPAYERQEYRDSAYAYVTNAAEAAASALTNAAKSSVSLSWTPNAISAADKGASGRLAVDFASSAAKTPGMKDVPKDLDTAVKMVAKWNKMVSGTVLANDKKVSVTLDSAIREYSSKVQGLGGLNGRYVDPLHVTGLIRDSVAKPGSGLSMPASLEALEGQWRSVAYARWPWKRSKDLDTPELDSDIEYLVEVAGLCPPLAKFDAIVAKSEEFCNSVTGGVGRANIEQDRSFEEKVLLSAFKKGLPRGAAVKTIGEMVLAKSGRIDFPRWTVVLEFDADTGASVTLGELAEVIEKVEANPTGIWVTAIVVDFDEAVPERGWPRINRVEVSGRVPCHL